MKCRVRELHLLIHPGFSSDPAFDGDSSLRKGSAELFRRYMETARTLGGDGLMVAIAHTSGKSLAADAKRNLPNVEFLLSLREVLGERLIVLADQANREPARMAMRIARARGFGISRWVRSFAYGEMLGECVEQRANEFNRSARLRRKTEIVIGSTDFALFYDSVGPEGLEELRRNSADSFRRISYGPAPGQGERY